MQGRRVSCVVCAVSINVRAIEVSFDRLLLNFSLYCCVNKVVGVVVACGNDPCTDFTASGPNTLLITPQQQSSAIIYYQTIGFRKASDDEISLL